MYCLLSTIPDKKHRHRKKIKKKSKIEDKIIRICLIAIWGSLFVFGIISASKPNWLQNISNPGKNMEAQNFKEMADYCLKNKKYNMAISAYNKALKIQPDLNEALINLAITYSQTGLNDKAIFTFKKLLKKESEFPHIIYYNLAEIYVKMNDYNEAIKYYIKSAETSPFPLQPYYKLAQLYLIRNELDLAINAFQNALKNRLTMSVSYMGMLKRDLQTYAIDDEISEIIQGFISKGFSGEEQRHYDPTIFKKVMNKNRFIAKIYNETGYAYLMKNDLQNAISHFHKALQIWPEYNKAKTNLKTSMERRKSKD